MLHSKILKQIRKDLFDISQAKFAVMLDVSSSAIKNVENRGKNISYKLAKKINEKLGYNADKLIAGELEKTESKNEFNLTDREYEELVKFIEEDKYTLFLVIKARQGDAKAADTLKKLLSD